MKILVINGPNLNLLGIREPGIYGADTYDDLCRMILDKADALGIEVSLYQSNHEGDIVTRIQQALGQEDAIVINPAAYTHTSIAILDALKAVRLPAAGYTSATYPGGSHSGRSPMRGWPARRIILVWALTATCGPWSTWRKSTAETMCPAEWKSGFPITKSSPV